MALHNAKQNMEKSALHNIHQCVLSALCSNPSAVSMLEQHWDELFEPMKNGEWESLLTNPNAAHIIHKYWDRILNIIKSNRRDHVCFWLCHNTNPSVLALIEKHQTELWDIITVNAPHCLWGLCINKNAVPFLEKCWDKLRMDNWDVFDKYGGTVEIAWQRLCLNPNAIHLIERHWSNMISKAHTSWWDTHRFSFMYANLCKNPNAIRLIIKYWDETAFIRDHSADWENIIRNPKIDQLWNHLCTHTKWNGAIPDRYWEILSGNPAIFKLDLAAMREQARPFAEELAAKVFHPKRVAAWEAAGIDVVEEM